MFDEMRPFTRADAVAAGISPKMLRGSRFRRLFRRVYVSADAMLTDRDRVVAALLVHPATAFASHLSAARLYGVPVPPRSEVHVSVFRAEDRRWHPGIKPHVAPTGTPTIVSNGIRVSAPVRMFVELAAVLDLVDLVVAGDAMLRVLGMTAAELRSELEKTSDYWSPAARHAAAYVRDGVDSPMESRLRMLLVLAGLPEPVVNHTLRDADGNTLARFDLSYPWLRLAIEYDGRQHVEVIEEWERDIGRADVLDDERWWSMKVIAKGVYVEPDRTLARIAAAIRRRGGTVPPLSDEWRAHFPTRFSRSA